METEKTLNKNSILVSSQPEFKSSALWIGSVLGLFLHIVVSASSVSADVTLSPDGAIGKPGLQIWGYRTDITLDATDARGVDGAEFSSGQARIMLPLSQRVTVFAEYRAENRLNILHQSRVGIRFRASQPQEAESDLETNTLTTNTLAAINPDGPLGHPYFTLSGGFGLYESQTDARFGIVAFEVTYPWTTHFTLSAGAEFNADTSLTIVNKFFGSLSLYTSRYLASEPYANPDGPVGYLNFRISGGGSGEGVFGQLDILFPMNDQMTIGAFVRGERVAFPYERSAVLGARFQLYPGVIR